MPSKTAKIKSSRIVPGTLVRVEKGCRAIDVDKGATARVTEVKPLGADYSHACEVRLTFLNGFKSGKNLCLYARHENRLGDAVVTLNDGNPTHKIQIVRIHTPKEA